MNRQIRLLGAGLMLLFVALFVQLNYVQIVHAPALDANPLNGAAVVKEFAAERGSIISADGVTLAQSVPANDSFKYLRQYPQGPLFEEVTGFFSFNYGSDGAERFYDKVLTGSKSPFHLPTSLNGLKELLTNTNASQSITLTVLDKVQAAAAAGLAGRLGSVVAIEPKTGGLLALYSNPTFDPNTLSTHHLSAAAAAFRALQAGTGGVLNPPAYRQSWFPGSAFKIVTSSAVYDHDPALATKVYPVASAIPLPQSNLELHNFAGEACGGMLPELLTVSCDTGFDSVPPLDLPFAAKSNFPPASSFRGDLPGVAYSAIGQQDVQATPLEMALVAAGIANGGTIMAPHLLDHVTNSQSQVVERYTPNQWLAATSPATAQTGTGRTDDWFVAFAPADDPVIAVSVVLPDQGGANDYTGGALAAPIARSVIEAYLASRPPAPTPPTTTAPVG